MLWKLLLAAMHLPDCRSLGLDLEHSALPVPGFMLLSILPAAEHSALFLYSCGQG